MAGYPLHSSLCLLGCYFQKPLPSDSKTACLKFILIPANTQDSRFVISYFKMCSFLREPYPVPARPWALSSGQDRRGRGPQEVESLQRPYVHWVSLPRLLDRRPQNGLHSKNGFFSKVDFLTVLKAESPGPQREEVWFLLRPLSLAS